MILNNSKCVGCSACMAICPTNAITMSPDEKGFLYPIIDKKLCVECGQCKNVCLCLLEKSNLRGDLQNIEYYLAKLNNVQEIQYHNILCTSYNVSFLHKGRFIKI